MEDLLLGLLDVKDADELACWDELGLAKRAFAVPSAEACRNRVFGGKGALLAVAVGPALSVVAVRCC